jgi:hypothetical protein
MQAIHSDYDLMAVLAIGGEAPAVDFTPPPGMEPRKICNLDTVSAESTECSLSDSEYFLVDSLVGISSAGSMDEGVVWEEIDPGVWRVPAVALPPLPEDVLVAAKSVEDDGRLPSQPYCFFKEGTGLELLPADAFPALFLSPPRNAESLKPAHEWAAEHDLPIFPAINCTEEILSTVRDPNISAVWRITSPKSGQSVGGIVPIIGTADFDPSEVQFYKVELGMGDPSSREWVTLGEIGRKPVVNDVLEMLHADGLPPADYVLRLIVVRWDGNYVGNPYDVEITIE